MAERKNSTDGDALADGEDSRSAAEDPDQAPPDRRRARKLGAVGAVGAGIAAVTANMAEADEAPVFTRTPGLAGSAGTASESADTTVKTGVAGTAGPIDTPTRTGTAGVAGSADTAEQTETAGATGSGGSAGSHSPHSDSSSITPSASAGPADTRSLTESQAGHTTAEIDFELADLDDTADTDPHDDPTIDLDDAADTNAHDDPTTDLDIAPVDTETVQAPEPEPTEFDFGTPPINEGSPIDAPEFDAPELGAPALDNEQHEPVYEDGLPDPGNEYVSASTEPRDDRDNHSDRDNVLDLDGDVGDDLVDLPEGDLADDDGPVGM